MCQESVWLTTARQGQACHENLSRDPCHENRLHGRVSKYRLRSTCIARLREALISHRNARINKGTYALRTAKGLLLRQSSAPVYDLHMHAAILCI